MDCVGETKVCRDCSETLLTSSFFRAPTGNGFGPTCKKCRASYKRQNRLIESAESRSKRLADMAARYKKYKETDPLYLSKQNKRRLELAEQNGNVVSLRDGSLKRTRKWYLNHGMHQESNDVRKRIELLKALGGKCVRCGYDNDFRALVLDHIHGDGKEDRAVNGTRLARHYLKDMAAAHARLQVLCSNCNAIKAMENKEHNKSRRIKAVANG